MPPNHITKFFFNSAKSARAVSESVNLVNNNVKQTTLVHLSQRTNKVNTIPELPVLNHLVNITPDTIKSEAGKTAVIAMQHMLHSTASLFRAIIQVGVAPRNIFAIGKSYSNCPEVIKNIRSLGVNFTSNSMQSAPGFFSNGLVRDVSNLWTSFIHKIRDTDVKNIIILDEGGNIIPLTPVSLLGKYKIIGVEQTMNGLMKPDMLAVRFPIIGVASSAAKKYLESHLIAEAVLAKLSLTFPTVAEQQKVCGVVGYGHIGHAIVEKLVSLGCTVYLFEKDGKREISNFGKNVIRVHDLNVLIANAEYIFGCTGTDISVAALEIIEKSIRDKVLISCSSGDYEYLSLLRMVQHQMHLFDQFNSFQDIEYTNAMGAKIIIKKGGFPVNFDFSGISVPNEAIQLTRGLMFVATLQGLQYHAQDYSQSGKHMLDVLGQQTVVRKWHSCYSQNGLERSLDKFESTSWIRNHSSGIHHDVPIFNQHEQENYLPIVLKR